MVSQRIVVILLIFLPHINDEFHVIKYGAPLLFAHVVKTVYIFHLSALYQSTDNVAHDSLPLDSWGAN